MGAASLPPITEATAFLRLYAPNTLQALAQRPDLSPALQLSAAADAPYQSLRSGLGAQAEVMATSLSICIERSHKAIESISQRLKRCRNIRFTAEVLASIGASGVIGTALLDQKTWTLVSGVLALLSSLLALFATRVVLGSDAREVELIAAVRRLTKQSAKADMTQKLLNKLRHTQFDEADMRAIIEDSNSLFGELNDALSTVDF